MYSDLQTVDAGVPQGSVTCVILFLIVINDLQQLNYSGEIDAIADDIEICHSNKSVDVMGELIIINYKPYGFDATT